MSQLRSATSIEMEIQAFLGHFESPELAADALIKKYEKEKLSLSEFEALSTYLLHCGFAGTLSDFISRKLSDGSKIPWGHFAEAIFLSIETVSNEIKKALIEGADEKRRMGHLARSHVLDHFDEELIHQRQLRRKKFVEKAERKKKELLSQLEVFRSQGLRKEEDQTLQKLSNLFPGDMKVYQLQMEHRERLAQDYIAKRPDKPRKEIFFPLFEKKDPEEEKILFEIEKSMHEALQSAQSLASDFALAMMIWDFDEGALRLLEKAPESPERDWLKAEVLLRSRRFLELLDELVVLEAKYSEDAETVFAVYYLRAQALWGLEQKKLAIEILEGMIEARPAYRAATSLLREWKEDFL
ncbi:MAG: hypothetical protein ACAH59_12610 [Pseudobdellovibrionaceae bacterium]